MEKIRALYSSAILAAIAGCETSTEVDKLTGLSEGLTYNERFDAANIEYNTLSYLGINFKNNETFKIAFELTNPRDTPICVEQNGSMDYIGSIDFFDNRLTSLMSKYFTVESPEPLFDGVTSDPSRVLTFVDAGQTIKVKRTYSRRTFLDSVTETDRDFDLTPKLFAQLEIERAFTCTLKDSQRTWVAKELSLAYLNGNFDFISERVELEGLSDFFTNQF